MATVGKALTTTWQQMNTAASPAEFLFQNISAGTIDVTFDAGVPSAAAPFHLLYPQQALVRNGVSGDLYARLREGNATLAPVSITE